MTQTVEHLHERIERLEHLLSLSMSGASSGVTFAGPIVANEAALIALAAPNGLQVFVLSHRSIWTKRTGVAGTQGVPPLVAHEVLAATDATGVFCRTAYSDPALRVGVNDIFIDPALAASNDENDGLTAATPLRTGYELFRRWGWGAPVFVGPNLATSPLGFIVIHVQSNLVDPDSLPMNVICLRNSSGISIEAPLLAANILRTATLTDAVTAMNAAVPLGGTRLTIRDNTLVTWAAFEVANRRVRFTDGPAAGGTLQPQTDNLATPGQVQCSPCQTTAPNAFSLVPTTVTPAVGNTYVVESLVQVNLGLPFKVDNENNPAFVGGVFVNIVNCNIPAGSQPWAPATMSGTGVGAEINMYQCTIDRSIDASMANLICLACYFFGSIQLTKTNNNGNNAFLTGGGFNGLAGSFGQIVLNGATNAQAHFDFCANGLRLVSVAAPVKNFASWNVVAAAGPNAGGHGVIVGGGGASPFFANRGIATFNGLMWGNGNPGAGVQVSAGCTAVGPPQNITGTQGDGKLADFSSTVGNNTYWDAATGTDIGANGIAVVQTGTTTLVAGVSPAIAANITATSRIVMAFMDAISGVNASTAKLEAPIATRAVGTPGSFVIQANTIADLVNVTDVSTVNWAVYNAPVASAFTWALLAAAKAAPGYGFSVHNRNQKASWVASETSA